MKRTMLVVACSIILLLTACSGNQVDADEIAAIVASTLQAQQPTDTPAPIEAAPGRVEGAMCFPSHNIPPMILYFSEVGALDPPLSFPINLDQTSYSFEVPEGTYLAYAWLPDLSLAGAYTRAAACNFTGDCGNDHSLVQFHVPAGGTTSGIDICDWYTEPGDIPGPTGDYYVPGSSAAPSGGGQVQPQQGSGQSASSGTGTITGSLSYPSSFIPSMNVIAFDLNSDVWYYVTTSPGSSYYQISNLPASTYVVIAYVAGENHAAGYTNAVPCGLSVDCPSHALIPVLVNPGQVVDFVDPQDWYAPEGTFRSNPLH